MANLYKCVECELNFVENEGDVCPICKQKLLKDVGVKSKTERSTGCYRCKTPIDSYSSVQCTKCGWLKCPACGACGCKDSVRFADYFKKTNKL